MRKIAIVSEALKLDFWPSSRRNCVVQQYTLGSLVALASGLRPGDRGVALPRLQPHQVYSNINTAALISTSISEDSEESQICCKTRTSKCEKIQPLSRTVSC